MNKNNRVVCFCSGGKVRSVSAKYILEDKYGYQSVLTGGLEKLNDDTINMLCRWAEFILVVGEERLANLVPQEYAAKMRHLNIGLDTYGQYGKRDLLDKLIPLLEGLQK